MLPTENTFLPFTSVWGKAAYCVRPFGDAEASQSFQSTTGLTHTMASLLGTCSNKYNIFLPVPKQAIAVFIWSIQVYTWIPHAPMFHWSLYRNTAFSLLPLCSDFLRVPQKSHAPLLGSWSQPNLNSELYFYILSLRCGCVFHCPFLLPNWIQSTCFSNCSDTVPGKLLWIKSIPRFV